MKEMPKWLKFLFVMPTEEEYILARIEFLVVVVTMLFLAIFIMDIFRGHFHNAFMRAILGVIDAASDSIVVYVMGAMQAAPFNNQMFPVWALVLVGFRHSIDFISGFGIPDHKGRRYREWRMVMSYLGVAFLNRTRGLMFQYPLWVLWGLQVVKSYYRLQTRYLAFNSVWHGKSSELVSEYMRSDEFCANFQPKDCDPETMQGYKYLVYGETKQNIRLQKPRYVLQIDTKPTGRARARARAQAMTKAKDKARAEAKAARDRGRAQRENIVAPVSPRAEHLAQRENTTRGNADTVPETLITLDKIWQCDGPLLNSVTTQGDSFKDISLAFSLSRMLRCRLEDVELHQEIIPITRKLVMLRIIKEEPKRAFGIMELEMAFVNDYFNTRYPMIFWRGFTSLSCTLILSVATFAVALWLAVDIRRAIKCEVHDAQICEVTHKVHGVHVDRVITWFFMFLIMFKEIWEIVSYLLSDWTRLLLACTYARRVFRCVRNGLMEKFISSFLTSKISHHRWHGVIDQHAFLQSYDDSPTVWNFMHTISTGAIPKKEEGTKLEAHIKIAECVKEAILTTLLSLNLDLVHDQRPDAYKGSKASSTVSFRCLPGVIPTLVGYRERYKWPCSELPTSSHIILVWHIATSLCEINFAEDHGIDLSSPGFPLSVLLYLANFCRCCCCSPQPYLVRENILDADLKAAYDRQTADDLKMEYIVANSLSRYCAYLLISKPDLLPDSFLVPKIAFRETMQDARHILKGCDSLKERYEGLMVVAAQDNSNSDYNRNVVQKGAKLAKELLDNESEKSCWEILAGVWVDLLVHIAPSWNVEAHKKCLESGGELITHIWALLWHCGIEKSMLWPVQDVQEKNAPEATQNSNIEKNNVQLVEPVGQAAGAQERDNKPPVQATTAPDGGRRSLNSDLANGQGNMVRKMQNLGNTCYFNAVLQSLLALDELRFMMLEQDPPPGGVLHLELKRLFQDTSAANYAEGTLVPENLFQIMCSRHKDINQGKMGDSNHALHSLLDDLISEEPEGRNVPSTVKSLFNGEVLKSVSNKQCGHNSVTTEALVLSLAIPSKEPVSIEDCLELYATVKIDDCYCTACSATAGNASLSQADTTVNDERTEQSDSEKEQPSHSTLKNTSRLNQDKEQLPMRNGVAHQMEQSHNNHKEGKKISRTATLKYRISKAPPVLTIQLKRFAYVHQDRSHKLEEHVSFQETLDITEFMDPRYVEDGKHKYCLVAVIVHKGSNLHEGHNFAYVRARRIGDLSRESSGTYSWFCASDQDITEVSLEQVFECQAYILFYQRVEQLEVKAGLEDIRSQITDQEKHEL